MTTLSFFISCVIAYGILSLYWKGRSTRYILLLSGCFCLFVVISAFVAAANNMAAVWYVTGSVPILSAFIAAFVSLFIYPYSLQEATTKFHVPDYMHTVDPSEFITTTFDQLPDTDHKGEALYTLLRVLYVVTSSRKKVNVLFPQVMKTAVLLYDAGSYTPNSIFFTLIIQEVAGKSGKRETAAVECAANLAYEAILSGHKSGELTTKIS